MSKTTVTLPNQTSLVARYNLSVDQQGNVSAGYQKFFEDITESEEVADGDPVSLTISDADQQKIDDALSPVMSQIIAANEQGKLDAIAAAATSETATSTDAAGATETAAASN